MKKKENKKLSDQTIEAILGNDLHYIDNWQNGETINYQDGDKRSAIFYAVLSKSVETVAQLLKSNPTLNIKDNNGWSPLHYAAQNYLINIAKLLLEHGAEIEIRDGYGNTPLWRAVFESKGKGEMIKLLLVYEADVNNRNDSGISPLELANTIANYKIKQFF